MKKGKILFLFIDESGNFDFSQQGTKYFILSGLSTYKPIDERDKFSQLKYQLLSNGVDQEFFHATEDTQAVRDQFFSIIRSLADDIEVHSVVAEKNKANPVLYYEEYFKKGRKIKRVTGDQFYERICHTLLQYVFRRSDLQRAEKIVVVLGAIFTRDKQSLILRTLKKSLKEKFPKSFEIYFHQAKADINCQIADYFGWAILIKRERGEIRPYELIRGKIKSEYEIFKKGDTVYY